MNTESEKPSKPGDDVFAEIGWRGGPEYLERDLLGLWRMAQSVPGTLSFAAFEALERVAVHCWDDNVEVDRPDPNFGVEPTTLVEVPWWVVHVLGHYWFNYRTQPGAKLAEAFDLEGGGQGKHRKVDLLRTELRDMNLATEFAWKRTRMSYEQAMFEVSERFGVSESMIERAWTKHGQKIRDLFGV